MAGDDRKMDIREIDHMDTPLPLRCRLGWHKWGGWSKPYDIKGMTAVRWQERTCLRCGRTEEQAV